MNTTNYITPYRWYNQYYKQSRFEKDCSNVCGFELLTDKNHLLPFQMKRAANASPIANWYLRPACVPPFTELLNDHFSTLNNWTIEAGICGYTDPEALSWDVDKTGSDSAIQIVNTTTGKTIGYTDWDTDLATTVAKLIISINTNTPNGTPFSGGFPFDNSAGFTASDGVNQTATDEVFLIAPPVGSGATYNGHNISMYVNGGVWTILPSASQSYANTGIDGTPCPSWAKECNNLKSQNSVTGKITSNTNLVPGTRYKVSIKVSGWANPGGTFTVEVKNNTTVIYSFPTAPLTGVFTFEFTASATDFHIEFSGQTDPGDYIVIDEIIIMNPFVYDASTDYILDKTLLSLQNTGGSSGFDYIIYCGDDLGQTIPEGTYYSIIEFLDTYDNKELQAHTYISNGYAYYFSEVITIKDFLPYASPYIKLVWYNDCDIQDVRYSSTCYQNWLYINGVFTKPEYPITEKGQTDGNDDFNATFQKWNKKRDLQFAAVPEFLLDALTAIRLHDHIFFYDALRDKQIVVSDSITIKSVEHEIAWILDDCRATFNLKCLLVDKIVDETCCDNVVITSCIECDITVDYYNDDTDTTDDKSAIFYGGYNSWPDGYYIYGSGDWNIQPISEGTPIFCIPGDDCPMFTAQGNALRLCPSIFQTVFTTNTVKLRGRILANTFAQPQYSIDGGSIWTNVGLPVTKTQFASGAGVLFARPSDSPCCGDTWYRVLMFDLNCEYCESDHVVSSDSDCC